MFLLVCYPFIAIPYLQSRKNVENNKSQVVYDDLKLNGNKVLWIKKNYTATTETGATQTMETNHRAELKQKIPTFSNPANQMLSTEQ